jgi:hypothetical protein
MSSSPTADGSFEGSGLETWGSGLETWGSGLETWGLGLKAPAFNEPGKKVKPQATVL